MAWSYRDIQTFPALYSQAMRDAVANLGKPVLLFSSGDLDAIHRDTERFRHYRWCLRQRTDINTILSGYEASYDFRLQTDEIDNRFLVYLTARPTKISDMLENNPALAPIILAFSGDAARIGG